MADLDPTQLTDGLLARDKAQRREALQTLASAAPAARARVVDELAARLGAGTFELDGAQDLLEREHRPTFGRRGHQRVLDALHRANDAGHLPPRTASQLISVWQQKGHDPARDVEEKSSLGARIGSVFTRAWVLTLALFVLIGLVALAVEGQWLGAAGLLVTYALLALVVDALLRRCPSCGRLLAGALMRIERDGTMVTYHATPTGTATGERHLHKRSWSCVHCGHRWSSGGR